MLLYTTPYLKNAATSKQHSPKLYGPILMTFGKIRVIFGVRFENRKVDKNKST